MFKKTAIIFFLGAAIGLASYLIFQEQEILDEPALEIIDDEQAGSVETTNPFSIKSLMEGQYPGSDLVVEQTLSDGSNYRQQIVSYKSEGLKIFALLTIPKSEKPAGGFPVIVLNHGSVLPDEYSTAERYRDYVAYFAKRGYMVLKSDYRGHANSEGEANSSYYHPGYVIDVLSAVASVQKHPDANSQKIGMWGHSSGGHITTVAMIANPDIKAGVIWGGLVASYDETFLQWRTHRRSIGSGSAPSASPYRRQSQILEEKYGPISSGSEFWQGMNPYNHLSEITSPIELHHGASDNIVPMRFIEYFKENLEKAQKSVKLYTYEGGDHNLSGAAFSPAMSNSVKFFDQYLK
ncbi:MAG: alpha/beta hydrolase [bacterium]|nr:alpha/beta hydrolase [bacterium]